MKGFVIVVLLHTCRSTLASNEILINLSLFDPHKLKS